MRVFVFDLCGVDVMFGVFKFVSVLALGRAEPVERLSED